MAELDQSNTPVLCIAGSDSSGKAGLSADMRTVQALGAHALVAVTAATAQTSVHFDALNPTSLDALESQLSASSSLSPQAIKIGLISSEAQVSCISAFLTRPINDSPGLNHRPVIYDPVFGSSSGASFQSDQFVRGVIEKLLPQCTLLTPNISETEVLLGRDIQNGEEVEEAATALLAYGCRAVLIKGGHLNGPYAQDYFCSVDKQFWLTSRRIDTPNTRGTGCVLSSAIASAMALGHSLYDAVVIGKMAINQGLSLGYEVSGLPGPLNVSKYPDEEAHLPVLSQTHSITLDVEAFPKCNQPKLDLYPVVDSAHWLERLLPLGISTIQLRIKDLQGKALEHEIIAAVVLAKKYQCRLFINDYWQLAIKHGAYGVHLGQEDLDGADIEQIRRAGLRLGTSTHCHYEVARAHAYKPSYIAVGPVYSTTTKDMPWVPHGLKGFRYWRSVLSYPLVAIGGVNTERILPLLEAGADSVAMITAITTADFPEKTADEYRSMISEFRRQH